MSEQGPLARPVVFRRPSYGSFGATVIEPGQDARQPHCDWRRSYSQARSAWLGPAAAPLDYE
jgi:hypothetical protein